jgi:hypothetical protein
MMDVTEQSWGMLKAKCLIDIPNACGTDLAYVYFVTYTAAITFVILNLTIAVILEGFEECSADDTETIMLDKAAKIWKKYDTNNSLSISIADAFLFVDEVAREFGVKSPIPTATDSLGLDFDSLKLKALRNCNMQVTSDKQVQYIHATRWALSLIIAKNDDKLQKELDDIENVDPEVKKLLDNQAKKMNSLCPGANQDAGLSFVQMLAVQRIEAAFAVKLARVRETRTTESRPRIAG